MPHRGLRSKHRGTQSICRAWLHSRLTLFAQSWQMTCLSVTPRAASWLDQIFSTKSARTGGVVRRRIDWIEREIGRERFELEVRRRGFHCIEAGRQLVVVCNGDPIRVLF